MSRIQIVYVKKRKKKEKKEGIQGFSDRSEQPCIFSFCIKHTFYLSPHVFLRDRSRSSPWNCVKVSARRRYLGICSSSRLIISTSGNSSPLHTSATIKRSIHRGVTNNKCEGAFIMRAP